MNTNRFVHDPIHGLISFDDKTWSIIDTPHFQRLRDIKQMDVSSLIFPGASHSRFEHSLGVGYLSELMIKELKVRQPSLEISDEEIESVKIAGLCHDLGHGPFSHLFDNLFIPQVKEGVAWSHEIASQQIFDSLVDSYSIDLTSDQVKLIKDLIVGEVTNPNRKFLYEIVANKKNSFDVDKFDYVNRDSYYIGFKDKFNFERIIHQAKVINDEICYPRKEIFNIWELYHKRYSLFKRVYTHPTSSSIQLMIVDVFKVADPHYQISNSINSVQNYISLTDSIIGEISRSKSENLIEARNLIKRIKERDLYKLIFEFRIYSDISQFEIKEKLIDIVGKSIQACEFEVLLVTINYGLKNMNPLNFFNFYSDNDTPTFEEPFLPKEFDEKFIRVFRKTKDVEDLLLKACIKLSNELYLFNQNKHT